MLTNKRGFSVVELVIGLVLVGALGLIGYKVANGGNNKPSQNSQTASTSKAGNAEPVVWAFSEKNSKWFVQSGTAPKCPDPPKFNNSPVDLSKAQAILMPGQYRGFNYKPHGGFSLKGVQTDVKMPMDAKITALTRYLENPDSTLQYIVTFENDCGIAFKFDHLYTLSPRLLAIAQTRPPALLDNTRSDPNDKPKAELFKAGEVIATATGHPNSSNPGFDFGVTDYRQPNEISKNNQWAALHQNFKPSEWYGVCWLSMMPGDDAAAAKTLSETPLNPQKPNIISDYCKNAQYTTLDFNGGQPTNG